VNRVSWQGCGTSAGGWNNYPGDLSGCHYSGVAAGVEDKPPLVVMQ
jgi:hypothetical protein